MWAALTFVLVVRPPAHQTVVLGLGRALWTTAGWQRLLATLLGVGFAFLGIVVMMVITDRSELAKGVSTAERP